MDNDKNGVVQQFPSLVGAVVGRQGARRMHRVSSQQLSVPVRINFSNNLGVSIFQTLWVGASPKTSFHHHLPGNDGQLL